MPTLENLKDELFVKLDKNPLLREFFKDMLEERVKQECWLTSEVVQLFLRNATTNLQLIEQLLQSVKNYNDSLLESLKHSLRGNDKHFDSKIDDLLAELNGAAWIIQENFSNIEKINTGSKKSPDFRANKNNELYLFEIKNLQVPDQILHNVFVQMEAKALIQPEMYKKNSYLI